MKVIIAGSRGFTNYQLLSEAIDLIKDYYKVNITEVVSGGAAGADTLGEKWAKLNNIPIKRFIPDWNNIEVKGAIVGVNQYGKQYNKVAGFDRNLKMAKYADSLVAFMDGETSGTKNMIDVAKKYKLPVFVVTVKDNKLTDINYYGKNDDK